MKRVLMLAASVAAALVVGPGPVAAAGNSAANGGALNMVNDPTMLTVPMVKNEQHFGGTSEWGSYGNAGMYCAVFITNDYVQAGDCTAHE